MNNNSVVYHPKNHALVSPQKPAYIIPEDNISVSYEELDRRTNQIAHVLRNAGIDIDSGIAFLLENREGFFELCWAAQRAGLHYTPISTHLKAEEIIYIVTNCEAKAFVISASFPELAAELVDRIPKSTALFCIGGELPHYPPMETLMNNAPATPVDDETAGSSMLYSSGTTGYPKGIRHTLSGQAIDYCPPRREKFKLRYEMDTQTIYLSPAPLYHAAPLSFTMAVMAFGGTCVIMKKFDPGLALAMIERFQITHSQWVPTMFVRLLRLDDSIRHKYDLSTHRVAIHAAAPCPVDTKRAMIEWWGPIVNEFYAGSEGVGTTYISATEWLQKPGSVGRSVDGTIHIVDENGKELPAGEIGTVYFADAPPFEYHGAPEKTRQALDSHGRGTLGDLGYVDKDGYLFLTDRKANMIISGGVNIYPQEAENVLLGHPAVLDAAVFGIQDEEFGESVKGVVELAPGFNASEQLAGELVEYCRAEIAPIKCPRSIDFTEKLPRLANGKLYKRELQEHYRSEN